MSDKRKTVGLMTMSNVINFGSALQTYATVKSVEKAGVDCVLIDYQYPSLWHINNAICDENKYNHKKKIIAWVKKVLIFFRLLFLARAIRILINHPKAARIKVKFQAFLCEIPSTPISYNRKSILKNPPDFDIYMTGSDQTWNPRYLHTDYSFLLNFVSDDAPKIAYAASFGTKKMLPEYREDYVRFLKRYDRISVRESSGVPLVKELTGKYAVHIPDPTLMLDKREWKEKIKNKLTLPEKFIFCYILDYVFSPYPQIVELVEHLAKISGLPVVVSGAGAVKITENCTQLTNDIGPEGFLECYDKASFVVTTSFHGTAFSVNFEKDFFTVLNPNASNDDRVKSFLESVGLSNRGLILSQTDISAITFDDMKTVHTESREVLLKMRQFSNDFLIEALTFAAEKSGRDENG